MPQASAGNVISASTQVGTGTITTGGLLDGTILDADINAAAAIAYSKLALTGAILNADLAGSIADSKLNQITSASKVSGAALTLLANIPVGAGVIPAANVPASAIPNWVDEGSISWAAESTDKTLTPTNTGKQVYMLIVRINSPGGGLNMQLNGATGANYAYEKYNLGVLTSVTGQTSFLLTASQSADFVAIYYITGISANSELNYHGNGTGANNVDRSISGRNNAIAANLANLTILVNSTVVTGKAHLYSLNL